MPFDARRGRWYAALMLFIVWVASLGAMAVLSGRRPPLRRGVAAPRAIGPLIEPGGPVATHPGKDNVPASSIEGQEFQW